MDIQTLKHEIALPGYAGLTTVQMAMKLNMVEVVVQEAIEINQLLLWAVKTQALTRLRAMIAAGAEPLASTAEMALRLLDLGLALDPNLPEVQSLLGTLVGAPPLFSGAEFADLLARGQRTISRATQLGLPRIYDQNVIDALHA